MKEEKSLSTKIIINSEAADVLMNPKTLRHLEPFLGTACTIKQAAEQTSQKANTVLARAKRFLALDLLTVVKEEKRGGRAIKHYQSTAEVFFVPYEVTTAESLETMMAERDRYYENVLRRGVVQTRIDDVATWGTRIYKDARKRLQIHTAVQPDKNYTMLDTTRPAVLSAWRDSVYLDFEDAKTLQQEMFNLLKKYNQKEGAQRYIVRLGMAPVL
jgi:hypothetical protein